MDRLKRIPFKYIAMVLVLVVVLMSETLFSTYSYFKYSLPTAKEIALDGEVADIDSVIVLEEGHSVGILAGETTSVEVNITNSTTSSLYYACWYEVLSGTSSNITITLVSSTATSGTTIAASTTYNVVFKISNGGTDDILVSVGATGKTTNDLSLPSDKTLIATTS